jgi:hypothetical protein
MKPADFLLNLWESWRILDVDDETTIDYSMEMKMKLIRVSGAFMKMDGS